MRAVKFSLTACALTTMLLGIVVANAITAPGTQEPRACRGLDYDCLQEPALTDAVHADYMRSSLVVRAATPGRRRLPPQAGGAPICRR